MTQSSKVSVFEDDYIEELQDTKRTAIWFAELSNGETVYMDDGRPGVEPPQAWLRLASYLEENALLLNRLGVKFRNHVKKNILPENAEGYFFRKQAMAIMTSSETFGFYLLGAVQQGKLTVQKWSVPELMLISEEGRDLASCGESLIWNAAHIGANDEPKLGDSTTGPVVSHR